MKILSFIVSKLFNRQRKIKKSLESLPKAKLKFYLPENRYHLSAKNIDPPKIGDVVYLDQGFSSPEGEPMALVYCIDASGNDLYDAEVYESELDFNF